MDNILKLVYDNWTSNMFPLPNGRHPLINDIFKLNSNELFEHTQGIIQSQIQGNAFAFDHSNFWYYFKKYYGIKNMVDVSQVNDPSCVYVWPIEIRTTPNSVYESNTLIINGQSIVYTLVDTMSPELLLLIQQSKVKILINLAHDPLDDGYHLLNIEKYLSNYGIKGTDIIFVPGNDLREEAVKYFPECSIKIIPSTLMISQQFASNMQNYPSKTSLGYVSDIMREQDLDSNMMRPKRFLCFNRSMRPHRYMMAYYALKLNLLPDSIFSFLNSHGLRIDDIANIIKLYCSEETNAKMYAQTIYNMMPYELDTQHINQDERHEFSIANNRKDLYQDSYIHITVETRFVNGETPFISEKTWRPIINLQPFVFVGNVHSLKLLHELGFKTFAPFIDESYDDETDPNIRFRKIYTEIEKLNNLSMKELNDWYHSIENILIHNQKQMETLTTINPFLEVFTDIKKAYA